jgi:hypothetical protein
MIEQIIKEYKIEAGKSHTIIKYIRNDDGTYSIGWDTCIHEGETWQGAYNGPSPELIQHRVKVSGDTAAIVHGLKVIHKMFSYYTGPKNLNNADYMPMLNEITKHINKLEEPTLFGGDL